MQTKFLMLPDEKIIPLSGYWKKFFNKFISVYKKKCFALWFRVKTFLVDFAQNVPKNLKKLHLVPFLSKNHQIWWCFYLAESEGFEPSHAFLRLHP